MHPLRLGFSLLLGVAGLWLATHPGHFGLLDHVDLAIHETGHLIFGPFGEVVGALGGTLFQLIVPATFIGYFAWKRDWYATTFPLWWMGQNCFNIARYIGDARAQELPLVGGGEHDWAFLLAWWEVLDRDVTIGRAVHSVGAIVCLGAAIAGVYFTRVRDSRGVLPSS